MRTHVFAAAVLAALSLTGTVAYADNIDKYHPLDQITYGNLVTDPDYEIIYLAHNPDNNDIVLQVASRRGLQGAVSPQVNMKLGDTQEIGVKKECSGGGTFTPFICKTYMVRLTYVLVHSSGKDSTIELVYHVEIVAANNNS